MKYQKKQLIIEAVQFTGDNLAEISDFAGARLGIHNNALRVHTLEGSMIVSKGDWIIKGIKGEFYPCKNDIFVASYDPISTN